MQIAGCGIADPAEGGAAAVAETGEDAAAPAIDWLLESRACYQGKLALAGLVVPQVSAAFELAASSSWPFH